MKIVLVAATVMMMPISASAQFGSNSNNHYNRGYMTPRGTYVQPHYSTNPNATQRDNYGASGNYNPYTGSYGTRAPRW